MAVGPLTNNPGHIPQQGVEGPHQKEWGFKPVARLNGFTWAISKENYQLAVDKRRTFLLESTNKKVYLTPWGVTIMDWDGKLLESSAQLGQEDELFAWANAQLDINKPCGIALDSFFWHSKGELKK